MKAEDLKRLENFCVQAHYAAEKLHASCIRGEARRSAEFDWLIEANKDWPAVRSTLRALMEQDRGKED